MLWLTQITTMLAAFVTVLVTILNNALDLVKNIVLMKILNPLPSTPNFFFKYTFALELDSPKLI